MTLQTTVIDTRDEVAMQASIQNQIDADDPNNLFWQLTEYRVRHRLEDGFRNGEISPKLMGTILDALPPEKHFEFFDNFFRLHFIPIAVINVVLEKTSLSADEIFEVLSCRDSERYSVLSSVVENSPEFIQLLRSIWPIWTPEQRAEIAVRDCSIYNYIQNPLLNCIERNAVEGERGDQFLMATLPLILEGLNLEDRIKGLQELTNASFLGGRLNFLNLVEHRENAVLSLKIYNLIGPDNVEKLATCNIEGVCEYLNFPPRFGHAMTRHDFAKFFISAAPPASPTIVQSARPRFPNQVRELI